MALPVFYHQEIYNGSGELLLNEDTSKHVVQVLRMKVGDRLKLTDGKGNLLTTTLIDDHKKKTKVAVMQSAFFPVAQKKIVVAISLIKNTNRFEWFLEKATEIGVARIIPLLCARTEKQHFRYDRMNGILISAMLQSQQVWLPILEEPLLIDHLWNNPDNFPALKFIAHCENDEDKHRLSKLSITESAIILIGPEGDFTKEEIDKAISNGFKPVALGHTRLRTETAGVVAATLLCNL